MVLSVNVSIASEFNISVIGLAPVDGNAVVKTTDNKMHVVKVGDTLPGTSAVVVQILPKKLVLEDLVGNGHGKSKQMVWLHKVSKSNGKSRVQRLERQGGKTKTLTVNTTGGKPK
jgi:hypothetical protein